LDFLARPIFAVVHGVPSQAGLLCLEKPMADLTGGIDY
jgi:hypothetical protein